jgi:pantothenate kinase-related protein Tda10
MIVEVQKVCGHFAENKDKARDIRDTLLRKWIESNEPVILDFRGIDSSTQSFVHALISEIFQRKGEAMLDQFEFKNCNKAVKSLISTVINYSLE